MLVGLGVGGTVGHRLYRWFKGRIEDGLRRTSNDLVVDVQALNRCTLEDGRNDLSNLCHAVRSLESPRQPNGMGCPCELPMHSVNLCPEIEVSAMVN